MSTRNFVGKRKIKKCGSIETVADEYRSSVANDYEKYTANKNSDIYVKSAEIINNSNEFYSNENIKFQIHISNKLAKSNDTFILIRVMDIDEFVLFSSKTPIINGKSEYEFTLHNESLVKGNYCLSIYIYKPGSAPYDVVDNCCSFTVLNNNDEFSHLETFNIGKVYNSGIWQ